MKISFILVFIVLLLCNQIYFISPQEKNELPTDYFIVLDITASMRDIALPCVLSDFVNCEGSPYHEEESKLEPITIGPIPRIHLARISIDCFFSHEQPDPNEDRVFLSFITENGLNLFSENFIYFNEWPILREEIVKKENEILIGSAKSPLGQALLESVYELKLKGRGDALLVLIFVTDLKEIESKPTLCEASKKLGNYSNSNIDFILFFTIEEDEKDLQKISECFINNASPSFFIPITTNKGLSFSHYDAIKFIANERKRLSIENEEYKFKIATLETEKKIIEKNYNSNIEKEDRSFFWEYPSLILIISILLILCIIGIILGIFKLVIS